VELRPERPWIHGEKQVAGLDEVTLLEGNFVQDAAYLSFHRNRGVGLHVADNLNIDGYVSLAHFDHTDRNVAAAFLATLGAGRRRAIAGAAVQDQASYQQADTADRFHCANHTGNLTSNPSLLEFRADWGRRDRYYSGHTP